MRANSILATAGVILCGCFASFTPADDQQPESEFGKNPLSLEQITFLLKGDVSTYDILTEAKLRGLAFEVNDAALREMEASGGDVILLNLISQHSAVKEIVVIENLARKAEKEKNFPEVIKFCNQMLERCPRYVEMVRKRGTAHLEVGDFEKAVADFTRASEFDPFDYQSRFDLAKALLHGGNISQAVFQLTAVIDELPNAGHNVFRWRGDAFLQLSRYLDAANDFRQAIQQNPQFPLNYARLADLLARSPLEDQQDADAAAQLAQTALDMSSASPGRYTGEDQAFVHSAHAAALAATGDFAAAVTAVKKAIDIDERPEYAESLEAYEEEKLVRLPPIAAPIVAVSDALTEIYNGIVNVQGGAARLGEGVPPKLVEPFLIGSHEVTNWEWAMVMGELPPLRPHEPKDFVNLSDVQRFLDRLNGLVGVNVKLFRLPTEEEWAFAAQAGQAGPWHFGDDETALVSHAWFIDNAEGLKHPVREKEANRLGLYDVYGNVAEWVRPIQSDEVTPDDEAAAETSTGQPGNEDEGFAVHRGGSYANTAEYVRGDVAVKASPRDRLKGVGFRIAATPAPRTDKLLERARVDQDGLDRAIQELTDQIRQRIDPEKQVSQRVSLMSLHYVRGISRHQRRQYGQAIEDFDRVIEMAADRDGNLRALTLTQLAWIHSTCPNLDYRDGEQALEEAEQAVAFTQRGKWFPFSGAAAASAEMGNFDRAVQREEQALAQAPEAHQEGCRKRIEDYKAKKLPDGTSLMFTYSTD